MIVLCSANPDVLTRWANTLSGKHDIHKLGSLPGLAAYLATARVDLVLLHSAVFAGEVKRLKFLRNKYPQVRLFLFSDLPEQSEGVLCLRLGAVGYANTYMHEKLLRRAVEITLLGEVWVGKRLMQTLMEQMAGDDSEESTDHADAALAALTKRERQTALLIAAGRNNKDTAAVLGVTERTVKAHLTSIFRKLGVRDRLQLALLVNQTANVVQKSDRMIN